MCLSRLEYKKNYRRRIFIETVGELLIKEHMTRRIHLPRAANCQQFILEQKCKTTSPLEVPTARTRGQKRGRCHICPKSDNKHALECKYCETFICKSHSYNVCHKCNK